MQIAQKSRPSSSNPVRRTQASRTTTVPRATRGGEGRVDAFAAVGSGASPRLPTVPLGIARLEGVDLDVLLPLASPTDTPVEAFHRYARLLASTNAFADDASIAVLLEARVVPGGPLRDEERPTLGVSASVPSHLVSPGFSFKDMLSKFGARGCRMVVVPPRLDLLLPEAPAARRQAYDALVAGLDGFLGPGGDDIDPSLYGDANTYSVNTNAPRDRAEIELLQAAHRAPLINFDVCRSHQLTQVAHKGRLVQDLVEEGLVSHTHQQERLDIAFGKPLVTESFVHEVETAGEGRLARVLGGPRRLRTNSIHHQAVRHEGEGFRVVARMVDPDTGYPVVEATESSNAFTFQWHPELAENSDADAAVLDAIVRRAQVCHLARGRPLSALEARMLRSGTRFAASDYAFAREDLPKHLPR